MQIIIKTEEEIQKMRVAGRLASEVLDMITPYVNPGVSTGFLDQTCHDYIVNEQKAIPAPLNYKGFPKSICTSINHQVCHGIPSDDKILKQGDIVNIDITVIKDGYHGDTSRMFFVGYPSVLARRLVMATYECMMKGIDAVRPGALLNDIGRAIEDRAKFYNFSVVRDFCGHGIGKIFHEDFQVLHYYHPEFVQVLKPGMIFTIEPMINAGKSDVKILPDKWTAVTKDHSLSAQWEHTVLVTDTGYEILTLSDK